MADLLLGGAIDPASHERIDTTAAGNLTLATDGFTTHGVIVGMTGSGKTGLGVVLIEEVLRSGVPVIAIDPKGDLTNLRLMFPDLAPADFRPWIDESQAKNAGQSPDDFAAAQATLWSEGLGKWGVTGTDIGALVDATDVTVYTPGSTSGVPLNLVGSLQVPADMSDAETVADEINGYVSGLLGLVGIEADPLSSREHILLSNLIHHSWEQGHPLDLPTLVGQVATPPIRKLGVFELDQFFPEKDRMSLAMKLNGLLASPSFAAWAEGGPLDIASMLFAPDGSARCAVITIAHLSDEERQFVTTLVLSKLVTWMRQQSGTTDLRAMLYMDEVAGYLPPTANPPTKQPIMLLMKQARAFGLGVVLSTQNPVDIDYKAISNAGTWMIGRLQTDRDKARLLDGMTSASGGADVAAIDATITGLGKREFVLRRAGKDTPEVFTTRWAMSYLRGPMTRDQISQITERPAPPPVDEPVASVPGTNATGSPLPPPPPPGSAPVSVPPPPAPPAAPSATETPAASGSGTPVMPAVATGIAVRYVDIAAPWLASVGGDPAGTTRSPAIVARVALRYDDTKADLLHDDEYEAVLHPLAEQLDVTALVPVDYDDRDLQVDPPAGVSFEIPAAPVATKTFWTTAERDIRDHLVRTLTIELPTNTALKLYGRPGESADDFVARCREVAIDRAGTEVATLRSKYETKVTRALQQREAADGRAAVLREEAEGKRNSEMLSGAGSMLGGLLGGRKSAGGLLGGLFGDASSAARKRGSTSAADQRVASAQKKVSSIDAQIADLEEELETEVAAITNKWATAANTVTSMKVGLEKTDVKVTQICLAWIPVAT